MELNVISYYGMPNLLGINPILLKSPIKYAKHGFKAAKNVEEKRIIIVPAETKSKSFKGSAGCLELILGKLLKKECKKTNIVISASYKEAPEGKISEFASLAIDYGWLTEDIEAHLKEKEKKLWPAHITKIAELLETMPALTSKNRNPPEYSYRTKQSLIVNLYFIPGKKASIRVMNDHPSEIELCINKINSQYPKAFALSVDYRLTKKV